MKNWIKILGLIIVVGAIVIAGYFVTHETQSTQAEVIHIGTFSKAIDYSPLYIARNKGWLDEVTKKYGVTIEYTEFQTLPAINEAFASGKVDVVFAAEVPAIIGKAAGIDTNIVYPSASLVQEVILHKNSTIKSVAELKGKKIAVLSGSSAYYLIVNALQNSGLSTKDVQLVDMVPPDAKTAFESNQVDAWAVWPPFPQQEIVAGVATTMPVEGYTQVVVIERAGFAKEQSALSDELLGVIGRARQWIGQNTDEAQRIVAQETSLPLQVVQLSYQKINFNYVIGDNEIADIQAKADFLYSIGSIKNKVDAKGLVHLANVQQ